MNLKMDPFLRNCIYAMRKYVGITVLPRRHPRSPNCVEVILSNEAITYLSGRLISLPEAEKHGYWLMIRPLTRGRKRFYHGHPVFQLFLTPVHPKKKHAIRPLVEAAALFEPIASGPVKQTQPAVLRTQTEEHR